MGAGDDRSNAINGSDEDSTDRERHRHKKWPHELSLEAFEMFKQRVEDREQVVFQQSLKRRLVQEEEKRGEFQVDPMDIRVGFLVLQPLMQERTKEWRHKFPCRPRAARWPDPS